MSGPIFNRGNHCGSKDCGCTHTGGCDRGFINLEDDQGRDIGVTPCPMCKGELADIVNTSWDNGEKQRRICEMSARSRTVKVASRPA